MRITGEIKGSGLSMDTLETIIYLCSTRKSQGDNSFWQATVPGIILLFLALIQTSFVTPENYSFLIVRSI